MEAADQCLLAQQARHTHAENQQQQLAETLDLLRQSLELQQQGDTAVQEFMRTVRANLEQNTSEQSCDHPREGAGGQTLQFGSAALDKMVVGGREKVLLTDLGLVLESRVDTGATTSSLDARDIEIFERDGEEWVRFKVQDPDLEQLVELERKRVRNVRITQSNTDEPERRPVIEMRLTLGNHTQVAEFTLSDRSHLENPILIGRNVLRDLMVVDVGRNFTMVPEPPGSSDLGENE